MNSLKLKIEGMHCRGCAERLQALLEKEEGVKNIDISHEVGAGSIEYNPYSINEDEIMNIIDRAGFAAEKD